MHRLSFWSGLLCGLILAGLAAGLLGSSRLAAAQAPEPTPDPMLKQGMTIDNASLQPAGGGGGGPMGVSFNFQGQLKKNGIPYTGSCDMKFDLYDMASGGIPLTTTTVLPSPVTLTNGLFTVNLAFPQNTFTGNYRSLEIGASCPHSLTPAYQTLTPRTVLYPTPYALGLRVPAALIGPGDAAHVISSLFVQNNSDLNGTGIAGVANIGTNAWGIYGHSDTGIGIFASGNGNAATPNTALQIDGGALKVSGANNVVPAFVVTVGSMDAVCVTIDNPLTNNNQNAMLFVTPRMDPSNVYGDIVTIYAGTYPNGKWGICTNTTTKLYANSQYNVLVIDR